MSVRITPFRVVLTIVGLFLLTLLILYRVPSGQYILLPDPAHPLTSLVRVQGAAPAKDSGTIYYVDVFERPATELEVLFPSLRPHATFVPATEIVPPGSTDKAVVAADLREMSLSQQIAAAVALRQLGYHVIGHPDGVLVNVVYSNTPAAAKLYPADVIQAVDGTTITTVHQLRARMATVKPGQDVTLRVRRGTKTLSVQVRTFAQSQNPQRALIGLYMPSTAETIKKLPIRVSINLSRVGGPSAGLAFALEVMEKLGKDVTHGHRVAATGEMNLNGTVSPIGGVKQKTWGVRAAGADVFLVPAGGNAETAAHFAGPVKVIPVRTFAQALRALATLPPAR